MTRSFTFRKPGLALIAAALAVVSGCEPEESVPLGSGIVPDAAFHAQARAVFDGIQDSSIAQDRELCGYFGFDAEGAFLASEPVIGDFDSCLVEEIPDAMVEIVASFHTHSSFDTRYDSEVPSSDDILSDVDEEVFGYIATPGGRVWLVDWRDATARQLCGLSCVTADPEFVAGDAGVIAQSYSLDDLREREGAQ